MTASELHDDLMERGADLMVRALEQLKDGSLLCQEQATDGITYASKIEKSETRIDWDKPARDVHNHIRGLSPFPGAWFEAEIGGKNERIKVLGCEMDNEDEAQGQAGLVLDSELQVACATGSVRLIKLQRAGKRPMTASDLLRGMKIPAGQILK